MTTLMSVDQSLCTKLHMHLAGLHTYTHRNGDKDTETDKSRQTDMLAQAHLCTQTPCWTDRRRHTCTDTDTHTLQWATASDATSSTTNI